MKNVKALLNKEEAAKKILATIGQEKETLAIKKLTEVKEILEVLGCGYLLDSNVERPAITKGRIIEVTKEVVKDTIAVTINKGKIVEVPGPVQGLVDMEEIEKHLDTINAQKKEIEALKKSVATWQSKATKKDNTDVLKQAIDSKDAYIAELEAKLQDKAYQAANDGYVVDGVEVSVAVVNELNKEVSELTERIAELESTQAINKTVEDVLANRTKTTRETVQEMLDNAPDLDELDTVEIKIENGTVEEACCESIMDDQDYLNYLNAQEESMLEELKQAEEQNNLVSEVVEEVVETVEETTVDAPKFVKVTNINTGLNEKAKMYQTEKCYLIASPTTDEITWLSNETLTDSYKLAVEKILVEQYKFNTRRTKLSPVKIERENGYLARCGAIKGFENFESKDKLAGYVKLGGKFYLFVYQLGYAKPYIKDLDAVIAGEAHTFPKDKSCLSTLYSMVNSMVHAYNKEVSVVKQEKEKIREENTKKFNEKQEARRKEREEQEALIAQSGIQLNKKVELKPNFVSGVSQVKTSFVGTSVLDELEAEF